MEPGAFFWQGIVLAGGGGFFQSNKIESKINQTQSNDCNPTKSLIYFAVSSIFDPIKHNRTQSDSITGMFGIRLLLRKSWRTNQGDGAPYKMSTI